MNEKVMEVILQQDRVAGEPEGVYLLRCENPCCRARAAVSMRYPYTILELANIHGHRPSRPRPPTLFRQGMKIRQNEQ